MKISLPKELLYSRKLVTKNSCVKDGKYGPPTEHFLLNMIYLQTIQSGSTASKTWKNCRCFLSSLKNRTTLVNVFFSTALSHIITCYCNLPLAMRTSLFDCCPQERFFLNSFCLFVYVLCFPFLFKLLPHIIVKIISLNVRGLRNPVKRRSIFAYLKNQKATMYCLQETFFQGRRREDMVCGMGRTYYILPWLRTL